MKTFLDNAATTEASWFGLCQKDFKNEIVGKKIFEMGCGDLTNNSVMAALGAEVYANDIACTSGDIVRKLNENHAFKHPIIFVESFFLENKLPSQTVNYVVGKAFLHHLRIPVERLFLKESVRFKKPAREAMFFESAVNNKILDEIGWLIPVKGGPPSLSKMLLKSGKKMIHTRVVVLAPTISKKQERNFLKR